MLDGDEHLMSAMACERIERAGIGRVNGCCLGRAQATTSNTCAFKSDRDRNDTGTRSFVLDPTGVAGTGDDAGCEREEKGNLSQATVVVRIAKHN